MRDRNEAGERHEDAEAGDIAAEQIQARHEADAAVRHGVSAALPLASGPIAVGPLELMPLDEVGVEELARAQDTGGAQTSSHDAGTAAAPDRVEDGTREHAPEGALVLERKHPLAIRWMHWINFPVLFTMIWSGLLIYWNDSDNAYRHAHEVYRVGVGSLTAFRFFPAWFYSNRLWDVRYQVTTGLGYHFFFMWLFAINGIVYVLYLLWSREWRFMVPHRESIREAIQVTLVDLHLRKGLPAQTKYNGAQRIAYSSVIVMGFGSLVTGLAIYKPTATHWLTTLLGGYEMARWLHFWLTIAFCAFFLLHVGQVILAGWNNFRAMVSGYELRRADAPSIEAERRRR